LKKTAAESYRLFGEAYGEHLMLHRKKCVNDGFNVSKLEVGCRQEKPPKKYEDGIASIAG